MTRASRPPRIELVIDEVVWHGGDEAERRSFAETLERGFARELRDPTLRRTLAAGHLELGSLDAGHVPRIAGDTVARAVSAGLARTRRSRS